MATYVLGDLQGCHEPLQRLLERLHFDAAADRLWFTGDLVNRGPDSLACLRFVHSLGASARVVLGNHDLHLLAVALDPTASRRKDTLSAVLDAPDAPKLLDWLRRQPLAHYDHALDVLLVHAGLAPQWSIPEALAQAAWAQEQLSGRAGDAFLAKHMYGDLPDRWSADLQDVARLRFIVNCFTRTRFVDTEGRLDFHHKGPPGSQPPHLAPWFTLAERRSRGTAIVFGHWSSLGQAYWPEHRVWAVDGGCVWGGQLLALHVERGELIAQPCAGR